MTEQRPTRRRAAILLVAGAVLANVAFVGLGSVFDYPDVLQQPAAEVLVKFHADQAAIVVLFSVLALGAATLAPASVFLARLIEASLGRWVLGLGIAAAVVQVIGLARWPLIVPSLADRATDGGATAAARADAVDTFELASAVLGTAIGETLGYLLTALWTALVVYAFRRAIGRWFAALGLSSAALILVGIVVPLGVPGADFANFVGYILWSLWLIAFATHLWRQQGEGHADERRGRRARSTGSARRSLGNARLLLSPASGSPPTRHPLLVFHGGCRTTSGSVENSNRGPGSGGQRTSGEPV